MHFRRCTALKSNKMQRTYVYVLQILFRSQNLTLCSTKFIWIRIIFKRNQFLPQRKLYTFPFQRNNRCLFWELYESHEYTLWEKMHSTFRVKPGGVYNKHILFVGVRWAHSNLHSHTKYLNDKLTDYFWNGKGQPGSQREARK